MPAAVAAAGPSLSFAFAAGPAAAASTTTRRRSQQPVKKMKPEGSGNGKEPPGGPLGNVLRVFRRDGEFLRTRLQEQQQRLLQRAKVPKGKGDDEEPQLQPETTGPLGDVLRVFRRDRKVLRTRVQEPLSKALGDLFWFRNLEDPKALDPPPLPTSWPKITKYPPGLSGFDLVMADLEALVVYANHLKHISKTLFMPLPDHYDPELVSLYFSWRPHVLGFRIIQIFLAFASAAIKVQTSKSFSLEKYNDMNESLDNSQYQMGKLVKETLLKLGPTFIKVGQSLSTRPDIIGSEFAKALSELHDKVPPFPRVVAMKTIEEELGSPERFFAYISEEPVAAASFGQVYYARTLDGNDVAVKVQRPNLLHTVVRDIYILRIGLGILRNVAKRKSDLRLYADELGKGFVGELDYTREAANASDFLDAHSHYSFIVVPKVYRKLTRKRVLTMQWIIGESPTELLLLSKGSFNQEGAQSLETQKLEAKLRLLDLVNKGAEAAFIQLLETGLLHADPHSGNLRYTPEGRIGFLDFGLLCRMEKKHQLAMLAAIIHIVNGDWKALVYDLTEMDIVRSGTSLYRVTMELEGALGEVVFINGIPDVKFSRVLGKIWSVALKYHFRMPPYFTLVLRSLASLEGLAVAGDQNFKTFQAAYPYVVRKLLNDNSAATRRILYSVVFNKRRELQWKKILLFIRLGSTSKKDAAMLSKLVDVNSSNNGQNLQEEVFKVANAILKILTSKNGAVLRRLLMDAGKILEDMEKLQNIVEMLFNSDRVQFTRSAISFSILLHHTSTLIPASGSSHLVKLIMNANSSARALISKDAKVIRHHMSTALSDIIYQWMLKGFMRNKGLNYYDQISNTSNGQEEKGLGRSFKAASQTALSDRRLKVIFYKASNDIRREPVLMFKLCWSFFMVFTRAAAIALHRLLVHISKTDATPFLPMRTAVAAQ